MQMMRLEEMHVNLCLTLKGCLFLDVDEGGNAKACIARNQEEEG